MLCAALLACSIGAAPALSPELDVGPLTQGPMPFSPRQTSANNTPHDAAWGAQEFVAAWVDYRAGTANGQLWARRISPTGAPIGFALPLHTPSPGFFIGHITLAFDGTNFWLAWDETTDFLSGALFAMRVSPTLVPLDPNGQSLGSGSPIQLVGLDAGVLLISSVGAEVGQRFDPGFNPIDPTPNAFPGQGQESFAWDGINTLIEAYSPPAAYNVSYATTLDLRGQTVASAFVISGEAPPAQQVPMGAAFAGSNFGVLYILEPAGINDYNGWVQRVSGAGVLVGSPTFIDAGSNGTSPGVVFGALGAEGTGYRVVLTDHNSNVLTTVVDSSGNAGPSLPISSVGAIAWVSQPPVQVTCGPAQCLAQWGEESLDFSTYGRLRGAVVSGSSALALVSVPLGATRQEGVAVAGASPMLAVWRQPSLVGDDLMAARVRQNGSLIDDPPLQVASLAAPPVDVAEGTDGWLVLSQVYGLYGIRGAQSILVQRDGGISNPAMAPSLILGLPSIATDGTTWLETWFDGQVVSFIVTGSAPDLNVSALPILSSGLTSGAGFDGTQFWLAFSAPTGPTQAERITLQGQVMETVTVLPTPSSRVAVTGFDGGFWVAAASLASPDIVSAVAMSSSGAPLGAPVNVFGPGGPTLQLRARGALPSSLLVLQTTDAGLNVASVDLDGGVTFWASFDGGTEPSSAAFDVGRGAIAYRRYDDAPSMRSSRLKLVLYGPRADGAPCGIARQCSSPFCEGGFCCPTACSTGTCQSGACELPDSGSGGGAGGGGQSGQGGGPGGGASDGGGPPPRGLRVGCGCGRSGEPPIAVLLLGALVSRRRRGDVGL